MADSIEEINNINRNQFNKILLLDKMATDIAAFGVQCGNELMLDNTDLNCGAIPKGDFEQVIDVNAAEEFLSLYTQIAECRFAYACTQLLKMNEKYINPLMEYCYNTGKSFDFKGNITTEQAFEIYNNFILNGMPDKDKKNIIESNESLIQWNNEYSALKDIWNKYEGNIENYFLLLENFINGLFNGCNILLQISKNIYTLSKKNITKTN